MLERGTIKWFNNRAGWGFIARERGGDVFLRHDRLGGEGFKALQAGQAVEFEVRSGPRGPFAVSVSLLPASGVAAGPQHERRARAS